MGLNESVSDLIDTTEMYLRTVFELEEEGIVPLRARIAERLGQSGPTVSQTVARMERDGLLTVEGDRHLELTPRGREYATRVMRKHRIAECLLVSVIGLPIEDVHTEACRWEHVMSDTVERRVPGSGPTAVRGRSWVSLDRAAGDETVRVTVRRIGESAQVDPEMVALLQRAGVVPGGAVKVQRAATGVLVGSAGEYVELPAEIAHQVAVEPLG